jgi:hypothetical protein
VVRGRGRREKPGFSGSRGRANTLAQSTARKKVFTLSRTLTPKQKRAARDLAMGYSQRVTARRVGVDPRTVTRWLSDNLVFREYVEELRPKVANEPEVEAVLRDLLFDDNPNIRLGAARELRRMPVSPSGSPDDEDDAPLDGWDE